MNPVIVKRYNRYSYFYDLAEWLPEQLVFAKYRQSLIPDLKGKILEVGVGTGKNLPYYNNEAQVTAIDFSPKMLSLAGEKLKRLGRQNISLLQADVEHLPFEDNSFDTVATTFVFCSVPDPIRGFQEIRRVLKEDGQAIFMEHVRSQSTIIGWLQNILNPLTVGLLGFNINRRTRENINKSGLQLIKDEKLTGGDVLRKFICRKQKINLW